MSKSIRIKDYLYTQIERLASENRRPLIAQLEILLEQALRMEGSEGEGTGSARSGEAETSSTPRRSPSESPPFDSSVAFERTASPYEKEFKPDFKPTAAPKKKGRR